MYRNIPDIMTTQECRKILKIGENTILDLIHTGELDAFKIGRRWKITKEAFFEYLKGKH